MMNEESDDNEVRRSRKITLVDGDGDENVEPTTEDSSRKRRTTLLGNLTTEGRLSRNYSLAHLRFHLTKKQREQNDETFALPPDDYFLMEEHDSLGIFLEKPEQLPGINIGDQLKEAEREKQAPENGEEEKTESQEEEGPPPDYVFPVQRNAVELHSKLNVIRSLRSYQHKYDKIRDERKCYYGEEGVDLSLLTSKPVTFLIIGKPGVGKTTLGVNLAEKMNSVHLNPENVIEHFRGPKEPLTSTNVNEKLESGESISDGVVMELLTKRIKEFDVLHRGYVLEGFPLLNSDDLSVQDQTEIFTKLTLPPTYIIIMQMQDKDLYKRRINQKFDPVTGRVYTRQQYCKYAPDEIVFNRHYRKNSTMLELDNDQRRFSEQFSAHRNSQADEMAPRTSVVSSQAPVTEDLSDTEPRTGWKNSRASTPEVKDLNEIDFPTLPAEVLERLFYRTEDFNIIVSDDLESFRVNFIDLQEYIDQFDKRKVLEVDAYWTPTIIFQRVWEFFEAIGVQPVPVPVQIMRPLSMLYYKKNLGAEDPGEDETDDDDESSDDDDDDEDEDATEGTKDKEDASEEVCEDEPSPEIDWTAALRTVCVRGLVDPRFRWRISRWQNLCPVALKLGRSTPGKPDLCVSFMDKVFFMSTKQAVEQFINNPRPYLLPKMPTSPIKFIVLGHPLAGKTTFAKELAQLTDGVVIDINKEVNRRFPSVKRDFIWKKRLKYSLEATNMVNRDNMLRWQRQERIRRRDMHTWIENHLKALAEEEIQAALERDRELLHAMRVEMRKKSEYHAMGEPFAGQGLCQPDDANVRFNWRKFISEAFGGKREWTHQELLQLAWDLFHQGRLYYKRKKRGTENLNELSPSESEAESDVEKQSSHSSNDSADDEDEDEGIDSPVEDDLSDELEDSDEDSSYKQKKKKKDKKKRKSRTIPIKKKCIQLEVKPVEPEDVVEPFLFESFDVDPDDPEVEESVRMRFPMIPFELVDIVPAPALVGDLDPMVQRIVEEKLLKDTTELDQLPVGMFVEILRQACSEVEAHCRKRNRYGALSGGWIIDNFPPEIEKWRAVLRTPQICPDQVFLMLDLTEGNMKIWSRFKKLYKLLRPSSPPQQKEVQGSSRLGSNANSARDDKSLREIPGEGGAAAEMQVLSLPGRVATGEDQHDEMENVQRSPQNTGGMGADLGSTDFDTEQEGQQPVEVDEKSLELVSRSHFMLSLLPKDDLTEIISMSPSERDLINRDLNRQQTVIFSGLQSVEDLLEQTMLGHEKYMLESLNEEFAESDQDDGQDSWSSVNFEEIEKRKEVSLKSKTIYGEMAVCLEEVDAFHHHQDVHRVSSDLGSGVAAEQKIKNPPGTPETGRAGQNSDAEDEFKKNKDDWKVPVPLAIAMGDIELSPEEYELKKELENDLKRLSLTRDGSEYIKTPTELGSTTAMVPDSAVSGESAHSNPLYHKLLTARIESPKRKFFAQVRIINEFWNMALPVCNQQGVRYWEVGLCDEDTALEKAIFFWNELESRFDAKAKKILETELKEEDEEILESLVKWGQPFEENDIRYRASKEKGDNEEEDDDYENETDYESEADDESESGSEHSSSEKERDELTALENKPELYWKALKRIEAERCFGDFKYYCPVTFADFKLLRKGSPKYGCKFKDRLYYCSDENTQLRFITNPNQFVSSAGPPIAPPPRICITGSPGCLQEEIAQELCTEFKICYVNFRQRLHEILYARSEREVGPENTMKIVPKEENERALKEVKRGDDLLYYVPENELLGEDEDGGHVKFSFHQIPVTTAVKEHVLGMIDIPSQEILGTDEQNGIQESALKSLGLLTNHKIETVPLNSFERTEKLTNRRWEKLTWVETYIKAFLENGLQLPDDVLDEFILPMWRQKPFTETGFILVGFPNTTEDLQYMIRRNLIPEHVFVMECKSVVIRNRLIVPAVDRWHRQQNPSGKKQRRMTEKTQKAKMQLEKMISQSANKKEVFPYQYEGRPEIDEFENETWSYKDAVSRDIARALRYFHFIYSSGLEKMKKSLNKERIDWTPVDTNSGLYLSKHKVLERARSILKYRSNVFEDTIRLSFNAAQKLLERGVFTLSQLQRWCPVELWKGNTGINLWTAPGVKKIAYLHRRYIYFIAGENNAKIFEENTWELVNQVLTLQPPPLVCNILGMPKSGKTTLAKAIADRLGLLYVSCQDAVESVLTHEFATEWSQILYEVNPALASSGHQPMRLAKELMEYVREGRPIPRFLVYRCLDLFLMDPKAQSSGVVFDDFPCLSDELIELNYREMTPCIVFKMRIPIAEAYDRCDQNRSPELNLDEVPQESRDCIDYLWDNYHAQTKETLKWFAEEYQNIHVIDGTANPEMVFQKAAEISIKNQAKIQEYLQNYFDEKPNTLEGTCPIISRLFHRLTPDFGFFCPVALNDSDELVSVRQIADLSHVVEYKNQIFLFSTQNAVKKFLNNPKRYTVPGCLRTPPKDIPQTLVIKPEDFERLHEHWGFMDFDPVLYYANHHFKGLQRGDPKYCVIYRKKIYVFINEENQSKFLTKPSQYWNLLLPMRLPRKSEPINYDKVTPSTYLNAKGMIPILRRLVKLMAEKRPRAPFMNVDQCAALFMGYCLKAQNMNSPFQVRQKYRDAMFKMSTLKSSTKEFLTELQKYYGVRSRGMPERLKKQLDEFIKYEHLPVEEKVLVPKIPGLTLGYDAVDPPFNEAQATRKVRRMMEDLKNADLKQQMDAFKTYSNKKKAAEDAAARAAQDAQDAAALADKKAQRAQRRLSKAKSRGKASSSYSDRKSAMPNGYF